MGEQIPGGRRDGPPYWSRLALSLGTDTGSESQIDDIGYSSGGVRCLMVVALFGLRMMGLVRVNSTSERVARFITTLSYITCKVD